MLKINNQKRRQWPPVLTLMFALLLGGAAIYYGELPSFLKNTLWNDSADKPPTHVQTDTFPTAVGSYEVASMQALIASLQKKLATMESDSQSVSVAEYKILLADYTELLALADSLRSIPSHLVIIKQTFADSTQKTSVPCDFQFVDTSRWGGLRLTKLDSTLTAAYYFNSDLSVMDVVDSSGRVILVATESNPMARSNVKSFDFTEKYKAYAASRKQPRVSLGIQVGGGLTPNGFAPYLGLGISYRIINFPVK